MASVPSASRLTIAHSSPASGAGLTVRPSGVHPAAGCGRDTPSAAVSSSSRYRFRPLSVSLSRSLGILQFAAVGALDDRGRRRSTPTAPESSVSSRPSRTALTPGVGIGVVAEPAIGQPLVGPFGHGRQERDCRFQVVMAPPRAAVAVVEAETHTAVRCDEVGHPLAVEFRFPEPILRDQLAGEYALLDRVRAVQGVGLCVRVGGRSQPAYSNLVVEVYSSSVSLVSVVIGGVVPLPASVSSVQSVALFVSPASSSRSSAIAESDRVREIPKFTGLDPASSSSRCVPATRAVIRCRRASGPSGNTGRSLPPPSVSPRYRRSMKRLDSRRGARRSRVGETVRTHRCSPKRVRGGAVVANTNRRRVVRGFLDRHVLEVSHLR